MPVGTSGGHGVDRPGNYDRLMAIKRASGARLYDVDGNAFIDYVMSWGPLIHGHAPKGLIKALTAAAKIATGDEQILYEVRERVATVTLNRPEKLNAWTGVMGREVRAAQRRAASGLSAPAFGKAIAERRRHILLAMATGTDVAMSISDITLVGGDISRLPEAIRLSP